MLAVLAFAAGCDTGLERAVDGNATQGALAVAGPSPAGRNAVQVQASIDRDMTVNGYADYLIYFADRPDLSPAYSMNWVDRGRFVAQSLQKTAAASQAAAISVLDANKTRYRSFWIDNVIAVTRSDRNTLNSLSSLPGVTRIIAPRKLGIIEPEVRRAAVSSGVNAVESNITHVGAPTVWADGVDGSGIIVANIDTGVRYTHSVLVDHYRGNNGDGTFSHAYSWFDPYSNLAEPVDENGHGSHTMGTMVGEDATSQNQVGMAPGARWIACRGCDTSDCTDTALLACAQWMAAPTDLTGANPDPDRRPHIVNNSWGDCETSYDNWYQGAVDSWHAAGIYPVFSNGNASNCSYSEPAGCNTVGNPGRYGNVTGVGSTSQASGQYATHSLWGPTDNPDTVNPQGDPSIKPQVVAPGVDIRSCVATGDNSFESWGGTSMSAPHVSGLIALAWQAAPCLVGDYSQTETLMEQTATPIPYVSTCGGEGAGNVPNNATGWGEINAVEFVQVASAVCGPSGSISGRVNDINGQPVSGASVSAGDRTTKTAADGSYALTWVPAGTVDVVAAKLWYQTTTVPGVVVVDGESAVVDLVMPAARTVRIRGTVKDGSGHGWPLYARIRITSADGGEPMVVFSDPFTGAWGADVVPDYGFTYEVDPWLDGYATITDVQAASTDPTTRDFEVPIEGCDLAGYEIVNSDLYFSDFESDNGGLTVSGTPTWEWGVPDSGPYDARSGRKVWATGLASPYPHNAEAYLNMPTVDASGVEGTLTLEWYQWAQTEGEYDLISVQASVDAGTTWQTIWGPFSGDVQTGDWTRASVTLDSGFLVPSLMLRFALTSDPSIWLAGWFIEDVRLYETNCVTTAAGLVGGFVTDGTSGAAIDNARVAGVDNSVVTAATPDDPNVPDGLYFIPVPATMQTLSASAYGYSQATANRLVMPDEFVRQDFVMARSTGARVSGKVVDGEGHGWPLYAMITFTAPEFGENVVVFTDPFTGEWTAELFSGYEYDYVVEPFIVGYDDLGGTISDPSAHPAETVFVLESTSCQAPGLDPDSCLPIPGGLFGGFVIDAVTRLPINGAAVRAGTSGLNVPLAPPVNAVVPDGLYYVFAATAEQVGQTIPVTATLSGMSEFEWPWPIVTDALSRHDIPMTEALLVFQTSSVQFQLLAGQSSAVQVGLGNSGNGAADFELVEHWIGGGGDGAVGPRILTYYSTEDGVWEGTPLQVALGRQGLAATTFIDDQNADFLDALGTDEWDLVIYDGTLNCDPTVFPALTDYVNGGGRLVFYCWQFFDSYKNDPLVAAMGISGPVAVLSPTNVYRWGESAIFDSIEDVPDFTSPTEAGYGLSGFQADVLPGAVAVAGYAQSASAGAAAMVVGNEGRTVWRGIPDYTHRDDLDVDGVVDTVELWGNTLRFLIDGSLTDIPWLSEEPAAGHINAGGASNIVMTADSAGLPHGTYTARVVAKTNQSRAPEDYVDVTMDIGHQLTVIQSANGTILPGGERFVRHHDSLQLWFTPDEGYHVADVIINGQSMGRQDSWYIEHVTMDLLVTAVFEFTCYTHDDCTHPNNDCVGYCDVDTCRPSMVKPLGWACGDPETTDCSMPDTCNDAGVCMPNLTPPFVMCRQSEGECDVEDFCDGVSAYCPEDVKSTAECRGAEGDCDVAEVCDGVDNDCPEDVKSTAECRGAEGVCDLAEVCDGVGNDCPEDVKSRAECRVAAGVCDLTEVCDGVGNDCPEDLKSRAECRMAAGVCDLAEVCDGVGNDCPADIFSAVAACDDGNACTHGDHCDGTGGACAAVGYECVAGPCDEAVACDGQGGCVPTFKAIGAECDDGMACTAGETCQAGGQCVAAIILSCDEPPHPECVDGDTSRVWAPDGVCSTGVQGCDYESRLFACADSCDPETGLCVETDVDCPDLTDSECTSLQGYPTLDGDGAVVCYYKPLAAGTECDDADDCTIDDECDGQGGCVGLTNPDCGVVETDRDVIEDTVEDTGAEDIRAEDTGSVDNGVQDVGFQDGVVSDDGVMDSGAPDVGVQDVAQDAGHDNGIRVDAVQDTVVVDVANLVDTVGRDTENGETCHCTDCDNGCSAGSGGSGHAGLIVTILGLFVLALLRRRQSIRSRTN